MARITIRSQSSKSAGKNKRSCYEKELCLRLQPKYGRQLRPRCPVLWERVNKGRLRIREVPQTGSSTLDCIRRIMAVTGGIVGAEPTEQTIALYAHRENLLSDYIGLMRTDLESLPKRLEKDLPDTSKKLAEWVKELKKDEFFYGLHRGSFAYLLPPEDMNDKAQFWGWSIQQTEAAERRGGYCEKADAIRFVCTYPVQAIRTLTEIENELVSLEAIFSEQRAKAVKEGAEVQRAGRREAEVQVTKGASEVSNLKALEKSPNWDEPGRAVAVRFEGANKTPPPKYDSLVGGVPYESKDRSRCHPRSTPEQIKTIKESSAIVVGPTGEDYPFPIKELDKYEDKELAWVVESAHRVIYQLDRWVGEEMTEAMIRYYVYNEIPCAQRVIAIWQNMEWLITYFQYRKPELSRAVKHDYDALLQAAKETDGYYERLSALPYYNEDNFNPTKAKGRAHVVREKLLHIASMAYKDLQAEKPTETRAEAERVPSLGDGGGSDLSKAVRLAYQSYEYALSQKPELEGRPDNEVYEWLRENGAPEGYELPSRDTWKRQVRAGRKYHGTQKNTPRAGREGGSVIKGKQIESLSDVSSQYDDEAD
ncbi:MAG: hypothetical protein JSU94_16745 [Phycisphaerales bacterium]|nr:MAG: hypothetical protein JSU94_16745 [Phycisphaerales bacterium]